MTDLNDLARRVLAEARPWVGPPLLRVNGVDYHAGDDLPEGVKWPNPNPGGRAVMVLYGGYDGQPVPQVEALGFDFDIVQIHVVYDPLPEAVDADGPLDLEDDGGIEDE